MDSSPVLPLVFGLMGSVSLALGVSAVRGAGWVERAASQRVGVQRWARRGREPRIDAEANVALMKVVLFGCAAIGYFVLVLWVVQALRGELR